MAKKPLTKEEQLALDLRRYESIISNPVFRNRGNARRIDMQPQNAAAVAQMIQNNPSLNPGGMLSTTTNNRLGLISDANAGSSMPLMQSDMQTNTQIPTQQTTSSNIFGDVLGTVFPGIDQSNKQLINAAILQGSLELLKPRQPGEGLAGQFGRAITAGQKVGTDLQKQELENLVAGVGLQKTAAEINKLQREAKETKQTKVTKTTAEAFGKIIDPLYKSNPSFAADIELLKQRTNDIGDLNSDTRAALELEAIAIGGDPSEAIQKAVKNYLSGNLVSNQNQTSTQTGVDPYAQADR